MSNPRVRRPDSDLQFLRRKRRPAYEASRRAIRVVDLFCGCGGLTLGLAEAARRAGRGVDIRLAIDADGAAASVFRHNFPEARVECAPIQSLFDGKVGSPRTNREETLRRRVGPVDILVGGPPCQGHSGLNNYTRRLDRRNRLYAFMARAAQVLGPKVVLIENVPAVMNDHGRVVGRTERALVAAGYRVHSRLLSLPTLGVPQRRRRHILIATRAELPSPVDVFSGLEARTPPSHRSVGWAIGDLPNLVNGDALHYPSRVSSENRRRITWLFEHGAHDLPNRLRPVCHRNESHTYKSMYGRLRWDEPAQTITTGFSSMGQGRYVHPRRRRTLTPREAARLQFFPDFFDFSVVPERSDWNQMIGNAVPPKLTMEFGRLVIPHL